jgi:hypothetical protein
LPKWELAAGDRAVCTTCFAPNTVRVFPALFVRRAAVEAAAAFEGEAACFDHPAKKAVASCHQCGRFVCQLCAIEFAGSVRCPSCAASGPVAQRTEPNVTSLTMWDSIALTLPLASLIFYPLNIFAAPSALTLAVWKWRRPISLVRRNRWRFVLAIVIAIAELIGWTALFVLLIRGIVNLRGAR